MKKHFLLFGLLIIVFASCKRNSSDTTSQAAIDDAKIKAYLAANHISATKGPSGIYYSILISDTSTQHPTLASTVQVSDIGKFLNGTQFDQESAQLFTLSGTAANIAIQGWGIGLPLMTTGERLLLIVPSALAYGAAGAPDGNVPIPPNTILVFTIDLIGFY
jgi:FKBP-type peptidyl-prolyl cis-trans isomerase FkpA